MTMTTTTADHPKNHQTMLDYGQIAFLQILARFRKESFLQKWAGLRTASPKYWLDSRNSPERGPTCFAQVANFGAIQEDGKMTCTAPQLGNFVLN